MPPPKLKSGFPPSKAAFLPLSSTGDDLRRVRTSAQRHINRRFRQFLTKAALIELSHQWTLELVAFVEEVQPERKPDIPEDVGVLRPGDDGARAHHGRDVAIHKGIAGEVGDPHHLVDN